MLLLVSCQWLLDEIASLPIIKGWRVRSQDQSCVGVNCSYLLKKLFCLFHLRSAHSPRKVSVILHLEDFCLPLIQVSSSKFQYCEASSVFFQEKDITLGGEHVREGLTCVVSVKVPNPEFEGQTKVLAIL
jgi:hypothetical protein